MVRHLHPGIRLFVKHDLLCFFTIVILCSIVLFDSWIVYLVCHVPSCSEYFSRSWVKLVCNFVLLILLYDCWDHFHCWWLAELCVELCVRVYPLSFHWLACSCPSPLFSLMGEACILTFLFTLRILFWIWNFFGYYFWLYFIWLYSLHIWSLTSFRLLFLISFVSWLLLGTQGSLLIFRSGLAGLRHRGSIVCWHDKHILILHKCIFIDIEINKTHFLYKNVSQL